MGDNNPTLYGEVKTSGFVNYTRQDEVLIIYKCSETSEILNCAASVDYIRFLPWANNEGIPLAGSIPKVMITNSRDIYEKHCRFKIKVLIFFTKDLLRLIKKAKDNNIATDVRGPMWQFGIAFGDDCDSFGLRKTIGSWIDETLNSKQNNKQFGTTVIRKRHHSLCPGSTKFICPENECEFSTRGPLILQFHLGEEHEKQYFRNFIQLYSQRNCNCQCEDHQPPRREQGLPRTPQKMREELKYERPGYYTANFLEG